MIRRWATRLRRVADLRCTDLRALGWTVVALRRVRDELPDRGAETVVRPPASTIPQQALPWVLTYLRRRSATCLESALIRQAWFTAHGTNLDIAIGVRKDAAGFAAHAWLVGYDNAREVEQFREITRIARVPADLAES